MKKTLLITSILVVCLAFNLKAQKGFLGKDKALTVDLNRLLLDRTLNAEINFMVNPNINLIPSIGYVAFSTLKIRRSFWDNDSSFFSLRGPTIGFRILATTYLTGQVAPLGHYYGYGYRFSSLKQREAAVRIRNANKLVENRVSLHDINIFYGKGFLLSENVVLSFDLAIGLLLGFGYDNNTSDLGIKTLNSYLGTFSPSESFSETSIAVGGYLRPTLKISYFFKL